MVSARVPVPVLVKPAVPTLLLITPIIVATLALTFTARLVPLRSSEFANVRFVLAE